MDNHLLIKNVIIGNTISQFSNKSDKINNVITCFEFVTKEGKSNWFYDLNISGVPNFYLSDHDILKDLYQEDIIGEPKEEEIFNLQGINLTDYNDITNQLLNTTKKEALLVKLMMYLDFLENNQILQGIEKVKGKYLDEIDFL